MLRVSESRAEIEGPTEFHMMSGSNINLTCTVIGWPELQPADSPVSATKVQ